MWIPDGTCSKTLLSWNGPLSNWYSKLFPWPVAVIDKYGCGTSSIQALVVNYPKYFTPNGDGYNDSWNIKDLSGQPSASIVIYDRFGKMLTQIKPSNSGWDGTYNGHLMPSDDYWFSVSYTDENQVNREFRAHFAMKR